MKIRIGKALTRETQSGKTAYSQAINVSQFPAPDAVIWHRAFNTHQLYPAGSFDADPLFVNVEYKKADGTVVRQVEIRFVNLVEAE